LIFLVFAQIITKIVFDKLKRMFDFILVRAEITVHFFGLEINRLVTVDKTSNIPAHRVVAPSGVSIEDLCHEKNPEFTRSGDEAVYFIYYGGRIHGKKLLFKPYSFQIHFDVGHIRRGVAGLARKNEKTKTKI